MEGTAIAEHGSHEARVFEAIANSMNGLTINELQVPNHISCLFQYELQGIVGVGVAKYGQGKAFSNKWIGQDEKKKFIKQV